MSDSSSPPRRPALPASLRREVELVRELARADFPAFFERVVLWPRGGPRG
jgi:hypothetical protein